MKHDKETKKEPSYHEFEDIVLMKLEDLQSRASIPIVQLKRVKAIPKAYNEM